MSESVVRKVQPFTIGTRLSVPAVSKCHDFSLDSCLSSLYLRRSQLCAHGPHGSHGSRLLRSVSPIAQQEDHLSQNSRSIRKITISGNQDRGFVPLASENRNNNNNSVFNAEHGLPRIIAVSCQSEPHSQLKVLLRQDGSNGHTSTRSTSNESEDQVSSRSQGTGLSPESQKKGFGLDSQDTSFQTNAFTQSCSLFSREVLQAEAWIQRKLQDLREGSDTQCCPLQDGQEFSQTLQRDLKDFENTLIQLNQMGEQLICKMNPTSELVQKQLSRLREQWQTLKQTAATANQSRTVGGARHLHDFNTKVEKLEAWLREKDQQPSPVSVLGDRVDKVQLTRRMLDLKQDEQLYRNLCEEINHLALKLERQGKAEGKNVASRRRQVNKMWLQVQARLKNHQENLQLALEVSSFYQQADTALQAIHNMRRVSGTKEWDKLVQQEIRDLAAHVMMLDVSASQLSNLHPALTDGVTQKQTEVKESWTLLQKSLREDVELVTAPREQCTVGTEQQRTMGKEVKEEQNRLKGFVVSTDTQTQEPADHPPSTAGEGPVCADDVTAKGERKPRVTAAQPDHPPLHVQLQKFTVSADKTLSWLKDNVHVATQVCSMAGSEGLEAARRCQLALEQEILHNRARIELVKREGLELVRAQHPGGSRIQEFVSQLEMLWEELHRRHQRNALFLQASEELGFRVVRVLQALGSLEAWLESVELSVKASLLAADAETVSVAERRSCLLERELTERGPELSALRLEVERLHGHSHPLTRGLHGRLAHVETKYQRVQSALMQQSSELQDTRMLAEFLQRVELEESQELSGSRLSLGQPVHSEKMDINGSAVEPLIESMGDPVEELREAVEMLNDTVRERGRSQSHDQAVRELLSKHASLAVRVEEYLRHSKDLGLDVLEKQTDMAIRCEPERCGLDLLWETQELQEMECEVIKAEVSAVQSLASRLQDLCPERVHVFGEKVQATLQAWSELRASVEQNKARLQEFVKLQEFFKIYLQMISWTEDTRSCIFSDSALHDGKNELDSQMEQKFEEFEELAAAGRTLLHTDHHLSQMVTERLEELRSMLSWICVHWRNQKQRLHLLETQENVYSTMSLSKEEERRLSLGESSSFKAAPQTGDGYEVMKSVSLQSPDSKTPESPKSSVFILKDKSSPSLGNTVSLILSFGNTGDSQVKVLDAALTEAHAEAVCRVSTLLREKDDALAPGPVYESVSLPRQRSLSGAAPPSPHPSPSPTVNQSHQSTGGSSSIFSSLKRIGKKKRRRRDTITGAEKQEASEQAAKRGAGPWSVSEVAGYDTRTWPLKHKTKSPAQVSEGSLKKRERCTEHNITPYAVSERARTSVWPPATHCRVLSLGSVLSFDLPKDMTLIPSIQDIITIGPPESTKATKTADPDPHSQRPSVLTSFKQRPVVAEGGPATVERDVSKDCAPKRNADLNGEESRTDNTKCPNLETQKQPPIYVNHTLCHEKPGKQENHETLERPENLDKHRKQEKYLEQERHREQEKHERQEKHEKQETQEDHKRQKNHRNHECLSVHTLIKDLNGHRFHSCARAHHGQSQVLVNLTPAVNLSNRQDSTDSGVSSLGSVKLPSDVPASENPKGILERVASLDVGCIAESDLSKEGVFSESVCVDHQQFEEVEEELEGIWSQNVRNSVCSDFMYQTDLQPPPSPQSPTPALFRNLVTASAPNLLVAEFRLPLPGSNRGHRHSPQTATERRSWAAFPNTEPCPSSGGTSVTVNETASDSVTLPEIQDTQRYIYQYRQEEEEQQEEEACSGQSQDVSRSRATAAVGDSAPTEDWNMQQPTVATGGRCAALSGRLPTMEGALERKQRLQLGGKKAARRGWTCCHAVLHRNTLCFYHDRKDTLRSSVCGLPLNLVGAECVAAPEYTKKPNCFHLRLRDGSEYLLNAASRFIMKKWILKIQASAANDAGDDGAAGDSLMQSAADRSLTDSSHLSSWWRSPDELSGQRRSHSFTSATYQKIVPSWSRSGGQAETGSNYCITLLVGDNQPPLNVTQPP